MGGAQRGEVLTRFLIWARPVFFTLLVLCAAVDIALIVWSRRNFALPGGVPVRIEGSAEGIYFNPHRKLPPHVSEAMLWGDRNSPGRRKLQQEIAPVIAGLHDDLSRAVALRQWVRSQCRKLGPEIEQRSIAEPVDILAAMRNGYSSQCGPLAYLYRESLVAAGIPARIVILLRNPPFRSDGHGTVEAFVNGKWILTDPTFNAHFTIDGRPTNAWHVRSVFFFDRFRKHQLASVYGSMIPDPNVENYNIRYYIQMDNILWEYYPEPYVAKWKLQRYPFTKLLQRNFMTIESAVRESVDVTPFRIFNYVIWINYVWLPGACLLLAALLALSFVRRAR
jgi:hypothetical protein